MSEPVRPNQFEFTEAQNQVFRELGRRMSGVGNVFVAVGVALLIGEVPAIARGGGSGVVTAVLVCVFGSWTAQAGKGFTAIASTQGSDIDHLMGAMGQLLHFYKATYRMLLTGLVVILVALVLAWIFAPGKMILGTLGSLAAWRAKV